MKNNKRSPLTIARQARFEQEEGMKSFHPVTLESEARALDALCGELVGIDTPEQKQARVAMESTAQGNRENSPELYGTLKQTRQKYFGNVRACHITSQACDVELDDNAQALVSSISNGANVTSHEENEQTKL